MESHGRRAHDRCGHQSVALAKTSDCLRECYFQVYLIILTLNYYCYSIGRVALRGVSDLLVGHSCLSGILRGSLAAFDELVSDIFSISGILARPHVREGIGDISFRRVATVENFGEFTEFLITPTVDPYSRRYCECLQIR